MIHDATGNLLEADAEVLVNTVNCVGFMGKGIALQFKKAFPDVFSAYKKACDSGEIQIGKGYPSNRNFYSRKSLPVGNRGTTWDRVFR
jgi:O-acetyl-ADP-ribose deacetylase (regulator of RNase III)